MAQQVDTVGTLSYNGVSFSEYTRTTGCSVRPEYSSDGRTVKHNSWSLSFETTINGVNKAAVDLLANRCRKALTKNGGPLILTDRAIGDIRVNVGTVRDVMNGPKPQELSFDPATGGNLTAKLRWSISWCVPECDDASYKFRMMDFSYVVSYTITNGFTTRTVRGKLQIPQNRFENGGRFSQDSADYYREQIVGDPPDGFKPGPYNFSLSEDRSTLTFDYSHIEMGRNVYPPGIIEATASQTMSTTGAGFIQWQTTITGSYEIAKNGDYRDAVKAFTDLLLTRRLQFRNTSNLKDAAGQTMMLPVAYTATEPEIYGRRKFNFSCTLNTVGSLAQVLNSGMWQQIPKQNRNSWRQWWVSVKDTAFHPRGTARLVFDVGEDPIIDLCGQTKLNPIREISQNRAAKDLAGRLAEIFPTPPADQSWWDYKCTLVVENDSGNALVREMPTTELKSSVFPDQGFNIGVGPAAALRQSVAGIVGAGGGVGNGPFVGNRLENTTAPKGVQGRGPAWVVIIDGYAVRFGHPIPRPSLLSLNGIPLMPLDRIGTGEGFSQQVVGHSSCPIYVASWRLRYGVEGDLSKIPATVPKNILYPDV